MTIDSNLGKVDEVMTALRSALRVALGLWVPSAHGRSLLASPENAAEGGTSADTSD